MMIDTDKHEGVTPAPWIADGDDERGWVVITPKHDDPYAFIERRNDDGEVVSLSEADARLIADAPLLLAEVKRLKEIIGMFDEFICNNWMPSNSYPYAPSPFDNVHSLWNELLWRAEEE